MYLAKLEQWLVITALMKEAKLKELCDPVPNGVKRAFLDLFRAAGEQKHVGNSYSGNGRHAFQDISRPCHALGP
jgi:hypothetical protein